jgi:hypothetical protein
LSIISYRRQETGYAAIPLFDRLADRYGRGQIFKDVDSIRLGDDFVEEITAAVGSSDVLLALIGEQWLTITDEQGRARLTPGPQTARSNQPSAATHGPPTPDAHAARGEQGHDASAGKRQAHPSPHWHHPSANLNTSSRAPETRR